MTARRPLLTATAAGTVLFALWFVPSANAFMGDGGTADSALRVAATSKTRESVQADRPLDGRHARPDAPAGRAGGAQSSGASPQHLLADTGSPNTTPYVIGGAACLALGAGLVTYSVRRTRDETC
ncbi:hypothetical protein FCH28_29090 [Streptomyces piniterrae]|uniref:LPXTG cell wall anchor domain-containing protein n=1 Tax=Streptomyces piniterrae TaxID=2571125 RepID=A0A4U0MWK2_9ACTN|nr:hypothetical protein [Streptomyces piniterrae]TJZ45387.1 hypothetical protein FCH28_29090 [Streptomyces piniterrae]